MNTKFLKKLGKNIKKYRIDSNLTQEQLAEKVESTQPMLENWKVEKIILQFL